MRGSECDNAIEKGFGFVGPVLLGLHLKFKLLRELVLYLGIS